VGYKEDNARKINEAFAKFQADAELSFRNGLEAVLDKGVQFCLDHHRDIDQEHSTPHLSHIEEGGYGWILFHNGAEVSRKVWGDNAKLVSDTNAQLSDRKAAASGWSGYVMASLLDEKYFNVVYEFIPMRAAIRDLKSGKGLNYNEIFKPVAV